MSAFDKFADFQLDVLKEVGNIGAGHAATALSKLLGKPVEMKVPQVKIMSFQDIPDQLGGAEDVVVAVFFRVIGEANGNLFFILQPHAAKQLLSALGEWNLMQHEPLTDLDLSALSEMGNILAGTYLSSLADFTKLNLIPTVPSLSIDMAGAVLSYGLIQFGVMGDKALLIDTAFYHQEGQQVEGHFFFIPDPDSFSKIFKALGVPFE